MTALLAAGCAGTVVDHVPLDIVLPGAPDCRAPIGPITLTALGDFPTTDGVVVQLEGSGAPIEPVTRFPEATLAFSVSARATSGAWDAFGWATRASVSRAPTVVLRPLGLSCPLADPEARLPVGGAGVAIDEARVMFVGGLDESGNAMRRIAVLDTRGEAVALPAVPGVIPVAFAPATLELEGESVLVTGGAAREGGDPLPTWERIPLEGGAATLGSLRFPRRDHAAIAVDAGRVHGVLLVGGSDGRAPVRELEWVDAAGGGMLDARLVTGRLAPVVLALDGNRVAIAGGADERGAAVTTVEILDLRADSIETIAIGLPCPGWTLDWIAPLPSGRLLAAGPLPDPLDPSSCLLRHAAYVVSIPDARMDSPIELPTIERAVALGMQSGRVLVEGRRVDGTRLAYVVDPGAGTVVPAASSRIPERLLATPEGTTLEVASAGASLRRDDRLTPFDAPPPSYLFAADLAALALDASAHWAVSGAALSPAAGVDVARLDVPALRLRRFTASIVASGAYDVVLTGAHGEPLATIVVTDATVAAGACAAPRRDGALRIARRADGTFTAGELSGCAALDLVDPDVRVGIGIVAHPGAALRSLALTRDP